MRSEGSRAAASVCLAPAVNNRVSIRVAEAVLEKLALCTAPAHCPQQLVVGQCVSGGGADHSDCEQNTGQSEKDT